MPVAANITQPTAITGTTAPIRGGVITRPRLSQVAGVRRPPADLRLAAAGSSPRLSGIVVTADLIGLQGAVRFASFPPYYKTGEPDKFPPMREFPPVSIR